MKIFLITSSSVFQFLIVVMFFIQKVWVPFVALAYVLSLLLLILVLIKERRSMERGEKSDDDRNY
ncbi:hypothetical protein [Anaerobacillus sp. 1_MG-2023]|uniref:hypothetical protein n=1 Tax=Anaerobacillus sp. 1_MG-2023 TaxID=3062655 RepID=UPI0026E1A20F|nr:hypothetical protein [Anaerobacillus sp. 1_MG-2023]MDO6655136.1 hypothetical protein [Anaerobacillus sp. 1_MG-2023]